MINLWPAVGQVVDDINGNPVPTNGIVVPTSEFLSYYQALVLGGRLLTYDPLNGGGSPSTVYSAGAVQAIDTDTVLGTIRGLYDGAQARTSGATVINAGDGDTWNWDELSTATPGTNVIAPDVSEPGRWLRDTSNGYPLGGNPGDILWKDSVTGVPGWRPFPLADVPVFSVADYGATGVGSGHDDTAAINACISAAIDPVTREAIGRVYFPKPTAYYRINSTILIQNVKNLCIFGDGWGVTHIRWHGAAGQPMFTLDGASRCTFRDLEPGGRNSNNPGSIFNVIPRSSGSYFTTDHCLWEDCNFDTGAASCAVIFDFTASSGRHRVSHSFMAGYSTAHTRIFASAYVHIDACGTIGNTVTNANGVQCGALGVQGGSYSLTAAPGGGGYHQGTGVDHRIWSNDGPIVIEKDNSEASNRILVVGDPSTPSATVNPPITFIGSRCDGSTNLNADGRMFARYNATPIRFENNHIFTSTAHLARFYVASTDTEPVLGIGDNSWYNNGSVLAYPQTQTASGVGTWFHSVIEYPNTWSNPPSMPVAHQQVWDGAASLQKIQRLPVKLRLIALTNAAAQLPGNNFAYSRLISGVVIQESDVQLHRPEADATGYAITGLSFQAVGAALPDGFSGHVMSQTANVFRVRFSHNLTGYNFRVNFELTRYA